MFQPAAGGTEGAEVNNDVVFRVLTREEVAARIQKCTIIAALEIMAHDQLLKERIAELEGLYGTGSP